MDENKYRNDYQERHPGATCKGCVQSRVRGDGIAVCGVYCNLVGLSTHAIELYRSTLDTCVSLTALVTTCGLVLSSRFGSILHRGDV